MSNDYLDEVIEKEANEFAFDDDKVCTPMERVLMYQAFIAGAKFILKVTSLGKKPKEKKDTFQ